MKKTPITKKLQRLKSSRRSKAKTASVKVVHAAKPVLKHFRLVSHQHTGKLIHFQHTSHIALLGMLVIVGFFLVISQNMAKAGDVSVGLVVQGPAPTVGAKITSPPDGINIVNLNPTPVSGSCLANSFVVVYNDGVLGGSSICTSAGIFTISVQLHEGKNVLTSRNFDNLNQAGPDTAPVTVTYAPEEVVVETPQPILPENPVIIPGVTPGLSECEDYNQPGKLETGGEPRVAVVCVPRSIEVNAENRVGVLVWGGTPPYALSFAWGSGESTLISMDAPGYRTVKVKYASSGIYNINIQVTDRGSKAASGQSAIQVTDKDKPASFGQVIDDIFTTSWFETPVPLYVIAVGLTLGFWGGDIFNRHFGARSVRQRRRRA